MWAYILAAARGDSRNAIRKRSSPTNTDDNLNSYRDNKVFMLPSSAPGPSGLGARAKEYKTTRLYPKKRSPPSIRPLNIMSKASKLEEGIEKFEEVVKVTSSYLPYS